MRKKNVWGILFLSLLAVCFTACNDDDNDCWYDSMEEGGPFTSGHIIRFYYVDGEGNDLINPNDLTTLPISSRTLLNTPPATPTELDDDTYYNDRMNSIVYDEYEKKYSYFTYAYGDSRFSDFTFYVYFKGEPDEMTVQHRYQDKIMGDGYYLSDIVSWKVNDELIYSIEKPTSWRKVFICKDDGKTTISFEK